MYTASIIRVGHVYRPKVEKCRPRKKGGKAKKTKKQKNKKTKSYCVTSSLALLTLFHQHSQYLGALLCID